MTHQATSIFPLAGNRETFLLIPAMPTPNGRFHLGHIGGPLLRMDVAARLLRSRGHTAHLLMATDIYEAHIPLQADKQGVTPVEVICENSVLMQQDLLAFNIDYDIWFDPQRQPARALYERHVLGVLQRMLDKGDARYVRRPMAFSISQQEFLARSLVVGDCPECGSPASGGVCEACGRQFSSHELGNARPMQSGCRRVEEGDLQWRELPILEFAFAEGDPRLDALIEQLESACVAPRFKEIALRDARLQRARSEMTTPGRWGIPWQSPGDVPQIVYNYCTLYPYMLALGELYCQFSGSERNAFEQGSQVISVLSFGTDVAVCGITYPHAFALADSDDAGRQYYKSFDLHWGNSFMQLEGSKFSTSRRHVIWAGELIERTPVEADAARFHLALIDPCQAQTTFTLSGLLETVNAVVGSGIIEPALMLCAELEGMQALPATSAMRAAIESALARQEACMTAEGLDLSRFARELHEWMDLPSHGIVPDIQWRYWFSKALALLAYPLMPGFAARLWRTLGHEHEPTLESFWALSRPGAAQFAPSPHVELRDLEPCLPESLRNGGPL